MNSKDNFLVKEALKGDKNAFRKLVDRYKIAVYNLSYRMIGNYAEAEDAAQETFLRVYQNLNRFKIEFKFSTWLFQICINICKNVNKQKFRHKVVSSFSESNSPDQTLEQKMMDKSLPQIEDLLEKKEEKQLLQEVVRELPHRYATVIVLKYWEGFSYREISQILNVSIFTTKTYLYRAREMLRDKLK